LTDGAGPQRGTFEAPALAPGPSVLVVPVVAWDAGGGNLVTELLGVVVLSAREPVWVSTSPGGRERYPASDISPPPPASPEALAALAFTARRDEARLVFAPAPPYSWAEISVGADGSVRRAK
jgi:hypothetical protein